MKTNEEIADDVLNGKLYIQVVGKVAIASMAYTGYRVIRGIVNKIK